MFVARALRYRSVCNPTSVLNTLKIFRKPEVLPFLENDMHSIPFSVRQHSTGQEEIANRTVSNPEIQSPFKTKEEYIHQDDSAAESDNEKLFQEIAGGDLELLNRLKTLEFEISMLKERYTRIPAKLKNEHWLNLLQLPGVAGRHRYLTFLFKLEKKKENELAKKEKKRIAPVDKTKFVETHMRYGITGNSLFMRIQVQSLLKVMQQRLLCASMYSQHIVFDCSYEQYMSKLNQKYCAKQLLYAYSANRVHQVPFHLKFCNFDPNTYTMQHLSKMLCVESGDQLPFDATEKDFLDLYPREKLVYLSPHCNNVLTMNNPDDIYIIGAFVDRGCGLKVSMAKAKEAKIRTAKLPLDHYLHWEKGTKNLPLNIVLSILLDFRYHGIWDEAFKNIPKRCLQKATVSKKNFKRPDQFD